MCKHKHQHKADSTNWSRRKFIGRTGLFTGASLLLSSMTTPLSARSVFNSLETLNNDNILVIIQLKGGNDGLNTIIPYYDFGTYQSVRRNIHIPKEESIALTKDFGMHGAMQALKSLWDKGMMKVINNVGYPNPNLSHFKSQDIWMSASSDSRTEGTGWIGRYMDNAYPNFERQPTTFPPAIGTGEVEELLFQGDISQYILQIDNPQELYEIAASGETFGKAVGNSKYSDELQFLRTVCNSTKRYAKAIQQANQRGKTTITYSDSSLSQQLQQVARLIKGQLGTRVYTVTLDGFDTHAGQTWKHRNLMEQLSKAIQEFYLDLATDKWDEKVVSLTLSEFGRRVDENGSRGTDHGTAAPVLLFGKGLGESKIIGTPADLKHLDKDGNLIHSVDFRSVYASVLQGWMGVSAGASQRILRNQFENIRGLF